MAVTSEPFAEAVERISSTGSDIVAIKRCEAPGIV
jgi:hypothetical protein